VLLAPFPLQNLFCRIANTLWQDAPANLIQARPNQASKATHRYWEVHMVPDKSETQKRDQDLQHELLF
jgi:hypothetical protein